MLQSDNTNDDELLLPHEVPSTHSFPIYYCNFLKMLTTILHSWGWAQRTRPDTTIDDEHLLHAEVPCTHSFPIYCNFMKLLTTILLLGYDLRFCNLITPLTMSLSNLLQFIQNRSVLQDAHPSTCRHLKVIRCGHKYQFQRQKL